jgi:regulator of protease activity HflC (stomatin/prohibitin superfamily)
MGKVYNEGFNWHMPWNSIFVYKTQISDQKEDITVLSSDGATIQLELSIWYHPLTERLDSLQVRIGPHYYDAMIAPAARGEARRICGKFKPEEIYSSKREEIAAQLIAELKKMMADKYINIENVIFRNVILPQKISDAINEKLAAQQEAQRMEFTLQKEHQEAERKRIEAQGISDFQKIVSSGLNPELLRWKGIEATEKLAQSPNAKIVVIGNAKDGLPLILGGLQ